MTKLKNTASIDTVPFANEITAALKSFEDFKALILSRAKTAKACAGEYKKAAKASDYEEFITVVLENSTWCAEADLFSGLSGIPSFLQEQKPDGLHVGGSLYLRGTGITALPDGLHVGGYLDLQDTKITALPDGLHVGGYLDLRGTGITALPDGLHVGGYLYLQDTKITALPDGLHVGGYLDLRGTGITALPDGLHVGGYLDLQDTKITALPDGLHVGGEIIR